MLNDRERELLEEIERTLLTDSGLRRRLASRGPRVRRALATSSLVALVLFLSTAAVGLFALALPGQSIVLLLLAVWPLAVLRRRLGCCREDRPPDR
jgi:hypothetical protein